MTINIQGKEYQPSDLTEDQLKLVNLISSAQVELQHREACLVVLQQGLASLQHQLVTSLDDVTEEEETDADN